MINKIIVKAVTVKLISRLSLQCKQGLFLEKIIFLICRMILVIKHHWHK